MISRVKPVSQTLDDERTRPDSPDQPTFLHHLARYEFALGFLSGNERVLDAGCGTGYGVHLLGQKASLSVGGDYSQPSLFYARERFPGANLAYVLMDCHQIPLASEMFHVVVSFEVFEHLEDAELFLRECHRVLKPGGLLILSTPNKQTNLLHMRSIGQDFEFHINLVDHRELYALLCRHFSRVELYGQRRRGNWLYTALRAADVWNLRLRWFGPDRRHRMQQSLGVAVADQARPEEWIFSRRQLRQANNYIALCRKEG